MKVLVTGGTGFLGQDILHRLLFRGHEVRALVRSPQAVERRLPAGVEMLEGDVLDVLSLARALEGVEGVIHAAGVVGYRRSDRPALKAVNEGGTANVVNLMLECGVKRLVHVSSTSALGRRQNGEVIDESCKFLNTKLDTYYGWSKYLGERQVHRGVQEGLEAVIANPSVILGVSDFGRSSGVMVAEASKGKSWYPTGGNGFVALPDVAEALCLLLESDYCQGERFVLNSENLSYKTLFELCAEAAGKSLPHRPLSPWAVRNIARAATLFGGWGPITPEIAINLTHTWGYRSDKFQEAFGFRFRPMAEVVREAARAYVAAV